MMFNRSEACFQQNHRFRNDGYNHWLNTSSLDEMFDKKFLFHCDNDWVLPDKESWFSAPPWKVKELEKLKSRLNFYKSQLNDFNIEDWSCHTRRRNPAGEVSWKLRSLINPEFLTQAWTKFYECAFSYKIVPQQAMVERKMVSLHLCEAPGAFITSLNHYLKLNHPDVEWQWIANTLNPYYEGNSPSNMISDDRFMFYTLSNWVFGSDNTGNLMDWENSQAIIDKAKSLGKVMLVTADGSIDCLQKPDAQEEITSPLHYCEIVTALQALSEGGSFLFKLFTMFEHSTVALLYLTNHLFEKVNIYKPITSRQGNSEVYAICLNYRGIDKLTPFLPKLKTAFGTKLYSTNALFPQEAIPREFIRQMQNCAYYFSELQCQVINDNLRTYFVQNSVNYNKEMKKVRSMVASEFIWRYNLKALVFEDEILKGILHEDNKINTNPRYHRGSYTERESYAKMNVKEKCASLKSFLESEVLSNPVMISNVETKWIESDEPLNLDLVFTHGSPLQRVNSSKFIFIPIFKLYLQILAEEEFKKILIRDTSDELSRNVPDDFDTCTNVLELPKTDFVESYHLYEKKCFDILISSLRKLSLNDSIVLTNFSLLTHFNVSVLFILAKTYFEKTGFTATGSIVLKNLRVNDSFDILERIKRECERVSQEESKDVLSCLPVRLTNDGEFFNQIVMFNNLLYKNKCLEHLVSIEQSL